MNTLRIQSIWLNMNLLNQSLQLMTYVVPCYNKILSFEQYTNSSRREVVLAFNYRLQWKANGLMVKIRAYCEAGKISAPFYVIIERGVGEGCILNPLTLVTSFVAAAILLLKNRQDIKHKYSVYIIIYMNFYKHYIYVFPK